MEAEEFADLKVLRYNIPGWDELDAKTTRAYYIIYMKQHSVVEILSMIRKVNMA